MKKEVLSNCRVRDFLDLDNLAIVFKPYLGWNAARLKCFTSLVLGVVLQGVAFPIAWKMLPRSTRSGNSKTKHHIAITSEVLGLVDVAQIRCLAMEREFVGKRWLAWPDRQGVPYVVRVKRNTAVGSARAHDLAARRGRRNAGYLSRRYRVYGQEVYFAYKRIAKGRAPYLLVVSNRYQGQAALDLYWQRWGIEMLFSHLKLRGFRFEGTRLCRAARVERLVGVLAVAFTLCHCWGSELDGKKPTKVKKHGHRVKSLFRRGLESLIGILAYPVDRIEESTEFFLSVILIPPRTKIVV